MNLSKLSKQVTTFVGQNSPALLTAAGVLGTVSTAYLTYKATLKTVIEAETMPANTPKKTFFKAVWLYWVPPVLSCGATITAIIFANKIGTRRTAALASAYTISQTAFSEYKDKVHEKLTEKKRADVKQEIAQDHVDANPPSGNMYIGDDSEVLFRDDFSGRYFRSTMEEVKKAQNDLNYEILHNDYASVNELYTRLGLPYSEMGELLGWTADNKVELEFAAAIAPDQKPCITITFVNAPKTSYWK